jgi:hypothetical protein
MRIYLSGPVTKIGYGNAVALFEQYERTLRVIVGKDDELVNPLKETPSVEGKSWFYYMRKDLAILRRCSAIAMLPGWERSWGARIERFYAYWTGKEVVYVEILPDNNVRMEKDDDEDVTDIDEEDDE